MEANSETDAPATPLADEQANELAAVPPILPETAPEAGEPEPAPAGGGEEAQPDAAPTDAESEGTTDLAEPAAAGAEEDPLVPLAAEAQRRRLSPANEERASKLLQEALVDGRAGVGRAIEHLPKLPWLIAVNAVSAVWQEMKPTFRTRLLAGLARVDSEGARRVRLSLARGLYKQDIPAALKIAVSVVKDMREKEGAPMTSKNAQIFANVFIGRAKPWVTQLPLADLKPAEADLIVQTAALAVFVAPHPPATQLGILKWAAEAGRLGRLTPPAMEVVSKGIERWNGKWRVALRREVAELPEEIVSVLRLDAAPPAPAGPEGAPDAPEAGEERNGAPPDATQTDSEEDDADEEKPAAPEPPRQRPVYESKTVPSQGRRGQHPQEARSFNLADALRQIEQHVAGLKNELQFAQNRLRQREEEPRRGRREERTPPTIIAGAPSPDELARLNQQLELRNTELQARLDELREDAEIRAASEPAAAADAAAQLRTVLSFKLQDDHADFLALEKEAPDQVVKQHYPVLLRHVFEVLRQEGVTFSGPPPEA